MEKNSENFSLQEAMRLAKTEAGQKILSALRQADPKLLQSAMERVQAGEFTAARTLLAEFLKPEEENNRG